MSDDPDNSRKRPGEIEARDSEELFNIEDTRMTQDVFDTSWDLFRNGFNEDDSRAGSEFSEGEIEMELWTEILEIMEPYLTHNVVEATSLAEASQWTERDSLLPILVSVVATLLVEHCISEIIKWEARWKRSDAADQEKISRWLREDRERIDRYLSWTVRVRTTVSANFNAARCF
jgi:hypothetical protein